MPNWSQQKCIEFALKLEENEEHMGENAAMAMTCEMYEIDTCQGYEVLISLPPGAWWLEDIRLSDTERAKLAAEYEEFINREANHEPAN